MDDITGSLRSLENVQASLKLAKLTPEELVGPPQILTFQEDASDEIKLIQLNKDVLEKLENGESLVFRGFEDDSAVLCTDNHTYDIKQAKTSNTLLLLPECTVPKKKKSISEPGEKIINLDKVGEDELVHRNVVGWAHQYFELKLMKPRVSRIKKLLEENPYFGPEKEAENSGENKYTLTQLLSTVQASEGELLNFLLQIGACCIDGYWRLLDFGYIVDCLGELFSVIESESWNYKEFPLKELTEKVNDSGELVPDFVVHHLMSFYGSPASEVSADGSNLMYKLNEEKVCRFFAEMLLKDVGKFNLKEFLDVWEQSVPQGMIAQRAFLKGLAIIDSTSKPATVQLFSVSTLPPDPESRFDAIFDLMPKWTEADIVPYVENLCLEGQKVSSLLTKYTRCSMQNKMKLYSSRKIR